MTDDTESLARTALDGGLSAIAAASAGARTGARLAVGTLFAGCNVLLDLGVQVTRGLSLVGGEENARLTTPQGEIPVTVRTVGQSADGPAPLGWWISDGAAPRPGNEALAEAVANVTQPFYVVDREGRPAVGLGGRAILGGDMAGEAPSYLLQAVVPALAPHMLGDPAFRAAYGVRYAYVAGAMANGISSEAMVEAMSRAGMLGFFGSAGLTLPRVEQAIDRLQRGLGDRPHGLNLIHSPNEPDLEAAVADLYLRRRVRTVSASAYLDLTLPLVRYRVQGIHRDAAGRVVCPNRVLATVSRIEVAKKFLSPPPPPLVQALVERGELTPQQAELARCVPMVDDLTAEADSGGHTDNQPAVALIPTMIALRDAVQAEHHYAALVRIGAAGGIGTPASAAAMLSMGAAYLATGSINQSCLEAGTSRAVREMLAQARQGDVIMAPAADMFEMGVKVQVLKWGTMFAVRARKLYDLYRAHASLEELPAAVRSTLERDYFHCPLEQAWEDTRRFFEERDPRQITRAESDPKHKLALVFRSYLGRASQWAIAGEPSRKADYQIWCGPAMGAFNEWAKGSFLEGPDRREVATVGLNILTGAAATLRAGWLKAQGVPLPPTAPGFRPLPPDELRAALNGDGPPQ